MFTFKLPDLGEGIHEGEILKWHVKAGDQVEQDAPLVDVETDKAAVTIPSPVAGRVVSLGAEVGEVVRVGQELVVIEEAASAGVTGPRAGEPLPRPEPAAPGQGRPEAARAPEQAERKPLPDLRVSRPELVQEEPRPTVPAQAVPAPPASAQEWPGRADGGRRTPVPAAPATRRRARELGVKLQDVAGSGPGGRVTMEDVELHARRVATGPASAAPAGASRPEPQPGARPAAIPFLDLEPLPDFSVWGPIKREELRSIRRRVAHKMTTSKILVPHVAHMDEADVTLLEEFRQRERQRRNGQPGGHLTLLAFVIKAVTAGLRETPAFNASLDPFSEEIIYKLYYHIGFAADTGKGLVVPVIRDTDRKSILQISRDVEELARRAREGSLTLEDMRGGTFTITNIGPLGGTALIPAINYPEVAILGMGRVQEKPVVREGQIVIRKMLPLTLAFDHRIADGADAARFVTEMVRQLSDPNLLLLET